MLAKILPAMCKGKENSWGTGLPNEKQNTVKGNEKHPKGKEDESIGLLPLICLEIKQGTLKPLKAYFYFLLCIQCLACK